MPQMILCIVPTMCQVQSNLAFISFRFRITNTSFLTLEERVSDPNEDLLWEDCTSPVPVRCTLWPYHPLLYQRSVYLCTYRLERSRIGIRSCYVVLTKEFVLFLTVTSYWGSGVALLFAVLISGHCILNSLWEIFTKQAFLPPLVAAEMAQSAIITALPSPEADVQELIVCNTK